MYKRDIAPFLLQIEKKYPVLTLVGPRQSGKSTLCRSLFSHYPYVSLEDPDYRNLAQNDARGFFKQKGTCLIIDEIQRVPDLISYIQGMVDDPALKARFILTGSHHLLLMEKVSQSLAGRSFVAKLLPFSKAEIESHHPGFSLNDYMYRGGYPRPYDQDLNPTEWLEQYYQSYVERDVRTLIKINELDRFDRFLRLCAARVGQLVNYSSLANDCGISQPTAVAWISLLQTSFILFTLQPHFKNFGKRLIKSPKLYFYDTGLLCYLLKIKKPQDLEFHALRGNIFENWVIAEEMKKNYNKGREPSLYFWRDVKGNEVDLVNDEGDFLFPTEIKSSETFHLDFVSNIERLNQLQNFAKGACVYAGDEEYDFKNIKIKSWKNI